MLNFHKLLTVILTHQNNVLNFHKLLTVILTHQNHVLNFNKTNNIYKSNLFI